jgi:hypothetical protein
MTNPFETLSGRLETIEVLLHRLLQQHSGPTSIPDVGGLEMAQQVTRLSKPRLYALVSARDIPHSKRGNKLYFNRAELLEWVSAGKRV